MLIQDQPFYEMTVDKAASHVRGVFVLDGAFCEIRSDTVTSKPPEILSGGFNYDNGESHVVKAIFPNAPTHIHFIFYAKYEPVIFQDVQCNLYWDETNNYWKLIINSEAPVISIIRHSEVTMVLRELGESITIRDLRYIISGIRQFFYLREVDEYYDVIYEKQPIENLNKIIENIKKYLQYIKDADYRIDLFLDSVPINQNDDEYALEIVMTKLDSRAELPVVLVKNISSYYGNVAQLSVNFKNDNDPFTGQFNYIPADSESFTGTITLDLEDTNYVINGILAAIPTLQYNYLN